MNTPGEHVDEWAVGGDGPVRRPRTQQIGTQQLRTRLLRVQLLRVQLLRQAGVTVLGAAVLAAAVVGLGAVGLGTVPTASAATDATSVTADTAATAATAATASVTTDTTDTSGDAAERADSSSVTTAASSAATDAPTEPADGFLPGATPDPSDSPTGPVYGHPTPTTPPTSTPPVAPTIADPGDITTGTARFHGRGTPGHTLRVASGPAVTCSAQVQRDGSWSCLGNVVSGPAQVFTVSDRTAPSLGTAATPSSDVVTPPTVATRSTSTGTVAGDGHPGATVALSASGSSAAWEAIVGRDGRWVVSLPRDVRDGTLTLVATQTGSTATGYRSDLRSAASSPRTIVLDRNAPAAPRILGPRAADSVRTQPLRVSGTGEPRAVVTVSVGRAPVCIATVGADGRWSCSTAGTVIAPGPQVVSAVQRDAAGNTSRSSSGVRILVAASSATPTTGSSDPSTSGSASGNPGQGTPAGGSHHTGSAGTGPATGSGPGTGPSAGVGTGSDGGSGTTGSGTHASGPGAGGGLDWSGPAGDWSARTAYDQAVPTIQSVFSWRTVLVATAVAAGFLVLVLVPLAMVAGVVRGRVRSPFSALLGRNLPRGRSLAEDALPTWVSIVSSVTIATLCTLLGTGVSLEARYVRLTLAIALGSTLLTAATVLATRWAAGRDRHLVGHRVSPVLVLAALVACALTRAGDLSPALVVGVVLVPTGRADLGTGPMRLGSDVVSRVRSATWRSAAFLVVAVAGWGVHSVAVRGGVWTSFVSDVAITLCVGGLGAAVVSLLPFTGSVGAVLLAEARSRYAALASVAAALTAAVYSGAAGTHVAPITWAVVVMLCVAAGLVARLWARSAAAPDV
ncbi:Ig-like domain-containing protein [Curtobacterium sp. 1P10AnD]|uniref:Ig-like domain-containing protein n=1 Tax=Curtobacterium sp. 1P10AnD TaxID=3132283 RepID=UPI00399FF929